MTDARFPERWLNDKRVVRLSDAAFRTFVTTLAWSVSNRTDGLVELGDLDLIHGADRSCAGDLLASGLWRRVPGDSPRDVSPPVSPSVRITVFEETQTSADELEVLDNARRREREKKARQRARKAETSTAVPGDVPGDAIPWDSTGQDRQGQDRQGQAQEKDDPEATDWPPVRRPANADACRRCGEELPAGLVKLGKTEHAGSCPEAEVGAA